MAESRVNKERKAKVVKFKTEHKMTKKAEQEQVKQENPQIPQLPPVRSYPIWAPNAEIKINGRVWEAIQNGLAAVQQAQQASQAVLTENLLSGTMQMEFEKLDPQTLEYVPMTDEEKKPHIDEFNKAISFLKQQQAAQEEAEKNSPVLDDSSTIVGPDEVTVD